MALRGGPLRSSLSAVSVPGWRPEDFHRLLTNFFEEGVVQGVGSELAVVQRAAGANMSVDVGIGLALIEFTTTLPSPNATLKSWLYNDAVINVPIPTADLTNPRIDRIVALFDVSVDPNTAASNIVSIELVEGTPAGSPSAPAEPSNAITLATISVPASDTAITDGQITDARTNVTLQTDVLADVIRAANLASTATGKGAQLVGVEDSAANFTGDTVEEVLAELQDNIDTLESSVPTLSKVGYGDGSDGTPTWTAGATLDPTGEFEYVAATLPVSQTLTVSPVNDVLVIKTQGDVEINGTVDLNGKGGAGGAGGAVNSTGTTGTAGKSKISGFTNAGGAGGNSASTNGGGGGGGASQMADGLVGESSGGSGGGAGGTSILVKQAGILNAIFRGASCGGGGGGGGGNDASSGQAGGAGGGALLWYIGGNLTLGVDSVIRADGVDGSEAAGTTGCGGGGGGGVVIIIVAGTITDSGVALSAAKGAGGTVDINGGDGAAGRVVIYSLTTGTLLTA